MGELPEVARPADDDALAIVDAEPLSADEALYARAARAANTVRGYRSDWRECLVRRPRARRAARRPGRDLELPLSFLAGHGAKVGTMSRRLSAIRFKVRHHRDEVIVRRDVVPPAYPLRKPRWLRREPAVDDRA